MREVSRIQRGQFPADLPANSPEACERSDDALRQLAHLIDSDTGIGMERQGFVMKAGQLIAKASWPYMRPAGYEPASLYEDGRRVPSMRMKRPLATGWVNVDLIQADSRLIAGVVAGPARRPMLVAGLPYQEQADFLHSGSCFVKDNRQSPGEFYDTVHEGPEAMASPLMDLTRLLLRSFSD